MVDSSTGFMLGRGRLMILAGTIWPFDAVGRLMWLAGTDGAWKAVSCGSVGQVAIALSGVKVAVAKDRRA
jgi:hypothetical protein